MKRLSIYIFAIYTSFLLSGCEALLEEPVKSEYTESTLLATKSGLESLLADAYGKGNDIRNIVKRSDMTTDILTQSGGGENGTATPLINFRWDPSNSLEAFSWMQYWEMIRNANIVLHNISSATGFTDENDKTEMKAEARFLRIWAYYYLWDQYGSMPIRKDVNDPLELSRASNEEFFQFMESELIDIINTIYPVDKEPAYGRANKGAALGFLCLWYLNTHQWQKCSNIAQDIIDGKAGKKYELFKDYNMMFDIENERNNEFIWSVTCLANSGSTNILLATDLPTGFKEGLDGYLEGTINTKWSNFASNYRLYDDFYYSFEEKDQRKGRILTKYISSDGSVVDLLDGSHKDNTRAIKFPPDPAASGNAHGNDFPLIRYAEILLAKAEALLELEGVNQTSIDLINQIRNRAGLSDFLLNDFSTKEALLEQILNERKWEFFHEGKRRRDLIRTNKYIQYAHDRGIINAQDYHVWFPLQQSAIDANSLLQQNDGY